MDAAEPSGPKRPARRSSPNGQRGGAEQYKHPVLVLIFLKYIVGSFDEHHAKILAWEGDYAWADPEHPDEYKADNVLWEPADTRRSHLQASAEQPTIGNTVDSTQVTIERDNPRINGVLHKNYACPGLDKHRLGELIDPTASLSLTAVSEVAKPDRSVDLRGHVNACLLAHFGSTEGKDSGQPSGARQAAKGSPQGERRGFHQFGVPPKGNGNVAWVQHFIHHLAPQGMAGVEFACLREAPAVLATGSMSSNQCRDFLARSVLPKAKATPQSLQRQRDIRHARIEADLADCAVALASRTLRSVMRYVENLLAISPSDGCGRRSQQLSG